MDYPLVTIGITCFNAQDTIDRAIQSALSQDWQNFEVIIVDDCSTDLSISVIEQSIAKPSYARLIKHSENLGPAGARNTILEHAKGDFIVFFDDDDESFPSRIQKQFDTIVRYEDICDTQKLLCFSSGSRLYPNGYQKKLDAIGSLDTSSVPQGEDMVDRLLFYGGNKRRFYGFGPPTCALMARTNFLREIGGFDNDFRRIEDMDLAIRAGLSGAYFVGCVESLFLQHATHADDKAPLKNLLAEQQLANKYKEYLMAKRRYNYAFYWPQIRYYHFMREYRSMFLAVIKLMRYHPFLVPMQLLRTGLARLWHDHKIGAF